MGVDRIFEVYLEVKLSENWLELKKKRKLEGNNSEEWSISHSPFGSNSVLFGSGMHCRSVDKKMAHRSLE